MTIGIPRALLYYKYGVLWETFFRRLGCDVVLSPPTNASILRDGDDHSVDESCVPSKIYMGHVKALMGNCDLILVPRIESFGPHGDVCVKFNALGDIVRNTLPEAPLICYNVDAGRGAGERAGFIGMGRELGKRRAETKRAYERAQAAQLRADSARAKEQERILNDGDAVKILLVSPPYNIHDRLIGRPVVEAVEAQGAVPVFADALDGPACAAKASEISDHLYWLYSRELVGAAALCRDRVDGILLVTAFPCGPDSLVNELLMRRIKGLPVAHILLDELNCEAGILTRIESFVDIIRHRKSDEGKGHTA